MYGGEIRLQIIPCHNAQSKSQYCQSAFDVVHDAYGRFTRDQLVLFLQVRNLPTNGNDNELSSRLAQFDLQTYRFPSSPHGSNMITPITYIPPSPPPESKNHRTRQSLASDLPVELWVEIMDHLGDWELSKAVGLPTSLPLPPGWTNASRTDHAVLTGYIPLIRAADPTAYPLTRAGAHAIVRLGYANVLEYLFIHHFDKCRILFQSELIPTSASRNGRTNVLAWWKRALDHHPDKMHIPSVKTIADAIDASSRNGQIVSLTWWLASGLPFEYTEASLELASSKNRIPVLDWWLTQHTEGRLKPNHLKIGKVMDMASTAGHVAVLEWWARSQLEVKYDRQALYHASCHGKVDVLQWWLESGLQMIFDQDALTGATKYNRPDVLEWWDKSGLPIQYRTCDIEEALEDALIAGEAARNWWKKKGVDFNTNDKEWIKLQLLN